MNLMKQPKGDEAAYWIDKGKPKAEKSWYQHGSSWLTPSAGLCPKGKCLLKPDHAQECWPS